MNRIHDAFIFYNEMDVLEIRLHELYPVVDRFIIVEGSKTYTGKDKLPNFALNMQRYKKYLDKIDYFYVDDWPTSDDPWVLERHQRNALLRNCDLINHDDFIIISDADEIPSREAVSRLQNASNDFYAFQQELSYFKFDYIRSPLLLHQQCCSIAIRKRSIGRQSSEECRASRIAKVLEIEAGKDPIHAGVNVLKNAGWHASYLGDVDFVRNKIQNFSHQEYNNEELLRSIDVDKIIELQRDLYGRSSEAWHTATRPVPVPHLIKENVQRFSHMLIDIKNMI